MVVIVYRRVIVLNLMLVLLKICSFLQFCDSETWGGHTLSFDIREKLLAVGTVLRLDVTEEGRCLD